MVMNHICKVCKIQKDISDFPSDISRAAGFKFICKVCYNIYQKQRRNLKPKKIKPLKPKPIITEKICTKCNELKLADQFNSSPTGKGKLAAICKKCHSEYSKNHYRKRTKTPSFYLERNKRHRENSKNIKLKVLEHYSNGTMSCACCGNNCLTFLVIDHINGGGNKERKENKLNSPEKFHYFLAKRKFPTGLSNIMSQL